MWWEVEKMEEKVKRWRAAPLPFLSTRTAATAALDHPSSAALSAPALKHSAAVTVKHTATATVSASATTTSLNQLTLGGAAATATAPATATTLNPLLTLGGAASGWRYSNTSGGAAPGGGIAMLTGPRCMTRSQHFFTITTGIDARVMQRTIHDQPYNLQWNKLQHFAWQIYLDDSRAHIPCQGGVHIATTLGHGIPQCGGRWKKKLKVKTLMAHLSPGINPWSENYLIAQIGITVCTDDDESKFSRMQMMIYTKGTHCVIFFFDLNDLDIKAVPQSHPIFSRPTYFSVIVWTLSKLIHCDQEGLYRSEHYLAFFLQGVVVREIEKGIRLW
ncbi:hypothetical protein BDR07DRAFT_1378792 [Suillus spraguei]|nr:hypothetical protein BDR07DRAFT_1378792 [Suillus spraguei]